MLDSFEELKDVALKNLEKCLSSEKMNELSEFAMFVETNRDTEKRISLGKLVDPRGYAHIVTLLIMVTSGTEVQMRQTCSTPPPQKKKKFNKEPNKAKQVQWPKVLAKKGPLMNIHL